MSALITISECCTGKTTTTTAPPPVKELGKFAYNIVIYYLLKVDDGVADPWLLIVTGYINAARPVNEVEVISLDPERHPVPACLRFPRRYPHATWGSFSARMTNSEYFDDIGKESEASSLYAERIPVVCGGIGSQSQNECYKYDAASNTWALVGTTQAGLYYPGKTP